MSKKPIRRPRKEKKKNARAAKAQLLREKKKDGGKQS